MALLPRDGLLLLLITVLGSISGTFGTEDDQVIRCLAGNWSYLGPASFDHKTDPAWTNQVCLYHWERVGPHRLEFVSPLACLDDFWKKTRATVDIGERNSLTFHFINDTDHQTVVKSGFLGEDCSLIDMDDGGLYMRSSVHPFFMPPHEWMRVAGAWLIRAAQITFADGTRHLTPGYPTAYNGQWLRDSFYGITLMWDLANTTHHKEFTASAEWMFQRARKDGIMPQYCPPDGDCEYGQFCNWTVGAPDWRGCQDLDSAGFSVKLAHHVWSHMPAHEQHAFYKRWSAALERGMNATTSDPDGSGLLWSNTSRPMVGYGFQDTVVKSGAVLYSSLLLWNASGLLASMANAHGDATLAERMTTLAARIKVAADAKLWDDAAGVFRASTALEHDRVDIWGNAMAGANGFASAEQSRAIHSYFVENEEDIFFEGQVREIPKPTQWKQDIYTYYEELLYQNGGYWATPLHHVLPFLAMRDRDMACRLLNQTIASFRGHGIWEWVGPFFPGNTHGASGYIASAAATYYSSKQLRCFEAEDNGSQEAVNQDVKSLLEDLHLKRFGYEHALAQQGFESMEALRLASDADLAACDMKVGHRRLVLDWFNKTGHANTFV